MKRYLIVVGILLLALVGVFTIVSCNNDTDGTTGYTDLTPAEAQNLIADNPDLIIIDVSPAYDQGHLPGAVSYPVGDGTLEAVIPTLDKDATYLVYCHVDSVAIQGALALVDAGFTNVYRLEGNYSGWVDAGYPIEQ
jgi:rhodanese-related sulfurtransferase